MKTSARSICMLAMLAALLVSSEASAQWGRGWGGGRGVGPGNGWGRGGGGYGRGWGAGGTKAPGCLFGPRMAYWLGLTRAQQDAIEELRLKALDRARPLWTELERADSEWAALVNAPTYDGKAAEALRQRTRDLEGKIEDVWSKYQAQALALLTPQQRQDYDRMVAPGPYGCWRGRHLGWEGSAGYWGGPGWGWRGQGRGWRNGGWGYPPQ